jgi:Rrf2 family protein
VTVTSRQREGALFLDADLALSARAQYALRAMLALAQAQHDDAGPLSVDTIASRHGLPRKFLEKVIADLRTAGLVVSTRGARGGYTLAQPASEISVGDIIRAAPSPTQPTSRPRLGSPDESIAQHLPEVWLALRTAQRKVLDGTSLEDTLTGQFTPTE